MIKVKEQAQTDFSFNEEPLDGDGPSHNHSGLPVIVNKGTHDESYSNDSFMEEDETIRSKEKPFKKKMSTTEFVLEANGIWH